MHWKGLPPNVYVALYPGIEGGEEIVRKVEVAIIQDIGPIACPRHIWIVPDMPKTRSGRIMRRVLSELSAQRDPGDVATLAKPEIFGIIRVLIQN